MSIISMVAHINESDIPFIQKELSTIKAVEILNIAVDQNKILLLLDTEDETEFSQALKQIQDLKQLQSLSYAAHYSEEAINQANEN